MTSARFLRLLACVSFLLAWLATLGVVNVSTALGWIALGLLFWATAGAIRE